MTDPPEHLRTALSDRYRLIRELGAGGMGRVYLAEDVKHHREVAVKVLRQSLDTGESAPRFLREIEIASGLSHPHIVPLYDSGSAGGFLYYVMPFVDGESLKARLEAHGTVELDQALSIVSDIADALEFAHAHRFVHRDIKPANILLSGRNALLADFGVARALEAVGSRSLTAADATVGTPYYMSPEQFGDSHEADGRSDLYSLGCVLYEMLSGSPPFDGQSAAAVIAGHLQRDPPSLASAGAEVPPDVEDLVARMLRKDPAERIQSAGELERAVASMRAGHRPRPWAAVTRRTRVLTGLGVAAVAAVAVAVNATRGRPALTIDGGDESVVVLPYTVPGGSTEEAELAVEIADEIILQLNRWESVRAVPQVALAGVSFDLGRRDPTFETVAQGLRVAEVVGVRALATVAVRVRGDSAVVTSSLFDVATGDGRGRPIESSGEVADPYGLAAGVVREMLGLDDRVEDIEELRRQSAFPEALSRQAEGRDLLAAWRLAEAEAAFRDGIAIDSTFAMAHHYLALSLFWQAAREIPVLEAAGPEIGRRSLAALRHASGIPLRDSLHIAAFHSFQEGRYDEARESYARLIERDSTDVYAWLLQGAVEYHDPWLVERSDGTYTPRRSLNVALHAFRESVRLSPGFHLGYGHLFDITRDVLDPIASGGSSGFELPRDEVLRPWERSRDPSSLIAFSPVVRDTLEWFSSDDFRRLERGPLVAGAERLLRSSMRTLQRWSEYAPEEWRPHGELAEWTIRERGLVPVPASPHVLDSLAAEALRHARRSLERRADTLAVDLATVANLEMATGDLPGAESTLLRMEEILARDPSADRLGHAGNVALYTGRPRAALAAIADESAPRYFFEDPTAPDQIIDDGGVEPAILRLTVLGATGLDGPELSEAFDELMSAWAPPRYSAAQLGFMKEITVGRVALALLLDPSRLSWFEIDADTGDPIWALIAAAGGEDANAVREGIVRAEAWEDVQMSRSARAYIVAVAAQGAGLHADALARLSRLDSIPYSVTALDPGWALLGRSYLLRGRSLEALGEIDAAREMYGRFLEVWADPDDLGLPARESAAEALRRLGPEG